MSHNILSKLASLAADAEKRGLDAVSFRAGATMREARAHAYRERLAAKGDQIEIESWPDFLNWWNNNRGQNLTYIFIDTYGAESEQVKMVKRLVSSAEKHERELHEFYMKLRDMAASQMEPSPDDSASEDGGALGGEVGDAAAAGEPMEPVDEEAALDEIAAGLDG